jgi:hypothetical protein
MEAYLHGVSTRKVDDLVRKAFGADTGISKSEVSRICAVVEQEVAAFRDRPLDKPFPYVTYCKARVNRRVVSQAVAIATGVAADGRRQVLGFTVGGSEDGAFWTAFLRSLKARGLSWTQLVISDAHAGLEAAIEAVLLGASWQRCRALHAQRAGPCPEGQQRDGRCDDPHRVRPARRRARPQPARRHRQHARPAVPDRRGPASRCDLRCVGSSALPDSPA